MSWLPMMAPSSTTHLPPDLFLLVRLWPVLAEMVQPVRSLPSKIGTNPVSSNFSGLGRSARDGRGRNDNTSMTPMPVRIMAEPPRID